jgi:hypothetical protein
MRWSRVLSLLLLALLVAPVARSGHELPVYPSYYPHEIEIAALKPDTAAPLIEQGKLHAFLGGPAQFAGPLPETVQSVESLGAFLVARANPALSDETAACAAVRAVAEDAARATGEFIFHPYPVTPMHGDFLHHVDRAEAAKAALSAASAGTPSREPRVRAQGAVADSVVRRPWRARSGEWDAEVIEIDAADLVAIEQLVTNGWIGPASLKTGWWQAYLILGVEDGRGRPFGAIDARARERTEADLRRLQSGDFADAVERMNLERSFIVGLTADCRQRVIGYTLKREYFNAEFSAGVENVGYDSLTGLNSAIFLRTVKLKDFPWNGWLALGIDTRPTAAWNPVAGFSDPFGRLMWSALGDPALLPAPYGSGWMINRVSDVQAAPTR